MCSSDLTNGFRGGGRRVNGGLDVAGVRRSLVDRARGGGAAEPRIVHGDRVVVDPGVRVLRGRPGRGIHVDRRAVPGPCFQRRGLGEHLGVLDTVVLVEVVEQASAISFG